VLNVAMGWKDRPRCAACLARALDRPVVAFLAQAHAHVHARECFRAGWAFASEREGGGDARWPACLFPQGAPAAPPEAPAAPATGGPPAADADWQAGDMTCGDLVLELRLRVRALPPGRVLRVTATDPSAPADLPAWCRVTGHALLHMDHPTYWIQRKKEE
jgi:tRNA 2-thiouridine synthesizing protein A